MFKLRSTMPVTMPVTMMPTHLRAVRLGILLYRRCAARIGQRKRLGAFGWSGQDQQCADRSKSQKSRHLHVYLPWVTGYHADAVRLIESAATTRRRPKATVSDVNVK
jgi:hypothetical protein